MAQYNFGVGQLCIVPSGTNPTPIQIGVLQDVSLDISRDTKELVGQNAFPYDVALGKGKISGKAKSGQIQSSIINAMLGGSTIATGQTLAANNENAGNAVVGATYTATNHSTWTEDMGVYDYTTGLWLTRSASAPANASQYEVAAGVYTFYSGFTDVCGFYYQYTQAAGFTIAQLNPLMGAAVTFQLNVFNTYRGLQKGYTLFATVFPKLSFDNKQDDFEYTDIEFMGFQDSLGRVVDIYTAQ